MNRPSELFRDRDIECSARQASVRQIASVS
jgi:hypothetical protein